MNIYIAIWFALNLVGVGVALVGGKPAQLIGFALSVWLLWMGGAFEGVFG